LDNGAKNFVEVCLGLEDKRTVFFLFDDPLLREIDLLFEVVSCVLINLEQDLLSRLLAEPDVHAPFKSRFQVPRWIEILIQKLKPFDLFYPELPELPLPVRRGEQVPEPFKVDQLERTKPVFFGPRCAFVFDQDFLRLIDRLLQFLNKWEVLHVGWNFGQFDKEWR